MALHALSTDFSSEETVSTGIHHHLMKYNKLPPTVSVILVIEEIKELQIK